MAEDAGATIYAAGLNLGGTAVSATAAELNIMDGVTATATELNLIDGVTATTAELNIMDGVTATAAELNLLDGATSLASSINGLSDGLVENNSIYLGTVSYTHLTLPTKA